MKITIFTEGEWDSPFIKALVNRCISQDKHEEIRIIDTKGWTNLHLNIPLFQETTDAGGKNLVIFDADSKEKNGGFDKRLKELNEQKKKLGIDFESFLFPDNENEGMFENLLENIVQKKHKAVLECFKNYSSCVEKISDQYTLPQIKSKIFAYLETVLTREELTRERKSNSWAYDNDEIWDFESLKLTPLKDFLQKHIE